jgi:hypothetical protein
MTRVIQIAVAMLLTFCVNSVLFAQGALSGGHTTADCIATGNVHGSRRP